MSLLLYHFCLRANRYPRDPNAPNQATYYGLALKRGYLDKPGGYQEDKIWRYLSDPCANCSRIIQLKAPAMAVNFEKQSGRAGAAA